MSMHLVGPYLTTTSYKKRTTKMTKAVVAEMETNHKSHNKFLKSINLDPISYDEYVDYIHGKVKKNRKPVKEYLKPEPDHRRETPKINSLPFTGGACLKVPNKVYTGTLIKGIATMHKSNAVPVINDEQAKEISSMRR